MKTKKMLLLVLVMVMGFSGVLRAENNKVVYPEGYRQWAHVKSMLIEPGHALENPFQGIHHVYANKEGLLGFKTGHFPEGSVLVFDLLQYKQSALTIQEGKRKLIGVMQKSKTTFPETGGWGFEAFAGDSHDKRVVSDGGKSCFSCHTPQKDQDYVFSKLRP